MASEVKAEGSSLAPSQQEGGLGTGAGMTVSLVSVPIGRKPGDSRWLGGHEGEGTVGGPADTILKVLLACQAQGWVLHPFLHIPEELFCWVGPGVRSGE